MNSTIYIKGDAGFKPVVLAKLGTWIHGHEDIQEGILSFSIPKDILLADFKNSIGRDNIAEYNLLFLDTLPDSEPKFVPGRAIKMSIWANKSYDLKALSLSDN